MNGLSNIEFFFPREYLRAAVIVSLLGVWVLVLLFHYLNRYTKREYFGIWTAGWLFYALWLTLGWQLQQIDPRTTLGALRVCCIGLSATFLLWGSLNFLKQPTPQHIFALFIAFLVIWGLTARFVLTDSLLFQLPVFGLNGLASLFAGFAFYRARKRHQLIGVGMLCLGFGLWGLYLFCYPFTQEYEQLVSAVFFFSAVLQLFIAVSMIVLVLEDVRQKNAQILQEIQSVTSEKEALLGKVVSVEERNRSLTDEAKLHAGLKRAYDDLRQTQERVMQLERMRALGQMASGIAHDINNALSPVVLLPDMIQQSDHGISDQTRQRLDNIRTAALDIAQVVARLRQFYRREQEKEAFAPVHLNKIVEQVVDLTRPSWCDIPQQHGLVVEVVQVLNADLPPVLANESEIREVLTNLILNALDAMPQGGKITISTRPAGSWARWATDAGPQNVVIEVRDTGLGMDEHTLRHCLDPFFTTKGARGGTGLGLATVYGIMDRHDGSVQIESQPGQGTAVHLILPVTTKATTPTDTAAMEARPSKPLRVLYVDDEPLLRSVIQDLLCTMHHQVEVADGGQKGIELFRNARARGEPFQVVITDLGMPQVDGRQVARAVKAESPETPVIMLTGWGMMLNAAEPIPDADELVSKPPRLKELSDALNRVTQGVRKASPAA